MTVTDVQKDAEALTMTITSEYDAPVERVWKLWEDPRQLERWWGPPSHPATFTEHDLSPGGSAAYHMTGPDGDRHHGWWKVRSVDAPNGLSFEDGFADEDGNPTSDIPTTTTVVTLHARQEGGTRMVTETTFPSIEAMEQYLSMGVEEGTKAALGQIDDILSGDA